MRIVHIAPFFYQMAGGGFYAVYHLAKAQRNLGHHVYILSYKEPHEDTSNMPPNDVKVFYQKSNISIGSVRFSSRMLKDVFRICPDVLHFHGMTCREQILLLSLASRIRQNRPAMLWTVHGLHEHYEIARKSGIGYMVLIAPLSVAMKIVDKVIALSPMDLKILSRIGVQKRKIAIISNGVEWELYSKEPLSNEISLIRQKYHLDEIKTIVLTICAIRANKGLEYLIHAASSLRNIEFVIVGNVSDKKYFEKLTKLKERLEVKNVKFLGWLSEEHKRLLLFASDVFVLSSLSETLPLVVMEAMAAGKPVIATSVGGIPYLIKDGINGLLVPPGDHVSLTNALEKLLTDPVLMSRIGEMNRQIVKQQYTWDSVARETVDLYEKLLEARISK